MESEKIRCLYDRRARIYDLAHHLQTLWADDIHRLKVVHTVDIQPKDLVLDIGAGTGLTAIKVALNYPTSSVVCVDFSAEMLKYAQANINKDGLEDTIRVVQADATQLPFGSNSFDCIISCYGLGGIADIDVAMDEIYRVGKPGARVTFAEMSEPPKDYHVKRALHKCLVEPLVKYFWGFRDLDLSALLKTHGIKEVYKEFRDDRILGSTTIIRGIIEKKIKK